MPDPYSVFLRGDPDADFREAAEALALLAFKDGNRDALDTLVAGTDGKRHPQLRRAAVQGLGLLGRKGADVQPVLQKLIKDQDPEVQKWAIIALGHQGDQALLVVHELLEMLQKDSDLTDYLQHAIKEITGKPSSTSWPRKSSFLYLGSAPYDDPIYQGGWNFIAGKNLNPRYTKTSGSASAEVLEQPLAQQDRKGK